MLARCPVSLVVSDGHQPGRLREDLAKLDWALRFVLDAYAEANNGKQPSARLIEQIKQGIQVKHNEMDPAPGSSPTVTASPKELQS